MARDRKASSAKSKAKAKAKTQALDKAPKDSARAPASLIDKTEAEGEQPKPRKLRRRDTNQQVNKLVYDHFKDFGDEELHLREVNGKNLWDRLKEDRERWRKGEIEMGNRYYRNLRQLYENPARVEASLRPNNPDDQPDDSLTEALTALIMHKGSFQQFVDWSEAVSSVNNLNLVAIFRQVLRMPADRSVENMTIGLATMKLVHRLSLHTMFPEHWALMRDFFDKVLLSSWNQYKSHGHAMTFWWRSSKQWASLILPAAAVDKVVACQGAWQDIEDEVEVVFNSSEVGRTLMGKAMTQVSLERVTNRIDTIVKKLMDQATITVALVDEYRAAFVAEMRTKCMDAARPYDSPKTVIVMYRGCACELVSSSPIDQFNLVLAAALRTSAVDNGLLPAMWCEDDLAMSDRDMPEKKIAAPLLEPSRTFREALDGLLSFEEATGPNISEVVQKKGAWLQSVDNRCRVELSFWASSIGEQARERVHAAILECLPRDGHPMTFSESLRKFEDRSKSKLMVFAGTSMASIFATTHGFVKSLKGGCTPPLEKAGESSFMMKVRHRLSLFCTYAENISAGSEGPAPPVLYGQAAVLRRYTTLDADATASRPLKLVDVAVLESFSWLLNDTQRSRLKEIGKAATTKRVIANISTNTALRRVNKKSGGVGATEAKDMAALLFER